ncbi:MAG: hypothetical protein HY507_01895 [Candidatus Zambryskibacteria bacterium]|nr:hypothetical protein [Candidatus Zambryskibacteria bacterium]
MNKKIVIVIGLVFVGISFYGGMKYSQSKTTPTFQTRTGNLNGQRVVRGGTTNGGFIAGEILLKDFQSITVKMQDGSSKIVLISPSTSVIKTVSGSLNDLVVGRQISTTGTANSDGSITAQSIQLRQATTTRQ